MTQLQTRHRSHKTEGPRPSTIRLGWIVTTLVFLLVAAVAGYWAYGWQRERNTQRLLHQARAAQHQGSLDAAIEAYGLYLQRAESDIDALRSYANLLHDRLAVSRSWIGPTIRALRQLNRLDPQDMETVGRLVRLYIDLREFAMAEELGRSWINAAPTDVEAILSLARASHGNNNNEEALQLLTTASTRTPAEPRFYPPLVDLLGNVMQQDQQAAEWLRRALANAPDSYEVQLTAFMYFQKMNAMDQAGSHLELAIERAPNNLDVLVPAARFYIAVNKVDRARSLIDRARSIDSHSPDLLAVRRALAVAVASPELLTQTADDLQRAAGENKTMLAQAAELYLRAGALKQADGCIQALDAAPLASLPKGAIDTLRGARALLSNQPHRAIVALESAVRQNPSDPWTLELLARAFVLTGAWHEAADLYRRLAMLSPASAGPRIALARVEIQNHKFERAREVLASIGSCSPADQQQVDLLRLNVQLKTEPPESLNPVIRRLEEASREQPLNLASLEVLLHALFDAGRHDLALEAWRDWSHPGDTHGRIALELARRHLAQNEIDRAEEWSDLLNSMYAHQQERESTVPMPTPKAACPDCEILNFEIIIGRGGFDRAQTLIDQTANPHLQGTLAELLAEKLPDRAAQRAAMARAAQLRPLDLVVRQKLLRLTDDQAAAAKIVSEIRAIEGDGGIQWKFEQASALLRLNASPIAAAEARDLLSRCLETRPSWVAARSLLAFVHERNGNLADAVEAYRAVIALDPDAATKTIAFRLIDLLKRMGRFAEADVLLAPIARALPDSIDVRRLLTEQHIRQRDLHSAAATAESILQLDPENESWTAVTVELLVRAGQVQRAEQIARDAFAQKPESITLAASYVQVLLAQEKGNDAIDLARNLVSRQESVAFDILLARVLVETGNPGDAEKALSDAVAIEPGSATLHAALADFWASQGDRARQLESTRTAVRLRGEDPNRSLWLAGILAPGTVREREEARSIARARLAADPTDADALLLDAQLALTDSSPDFDRAESNLTAVIRINPRAIAAYKLLTALFLKKDNLSRANESATAGLMAAGDDTEMLVLAAEVSQQRREWDASMIPLRRLFSNSRLPLRAFELLASAATTTGQIDQALALMEGTAPRPEEANIFLGRLYESKGDRIKAEELFRLAANQSPATGVPAYLLFLSRQDRFEDIESWADNDQCAIPHRLVAAEILASHSSASASRRRGFERLERLATLDSAFAADARYRAGMAYMKHADFVNAETMLLSAVTLAPQSPKAANALAWLYGEELANPARGLDVLRRFENNGGVPTPEMLDTRGMLLWKEKRYDEAVVLLKECLRAGNRSPAAASAHFHFALVQRQRNEIDEANNLLKTAIQIHERFGGLTARQLDEARRLLSSDLSG